MSINRAKHKPRVLSLFTGAGGLDIGFEAAGYRHVGCADLDPTACATIEKNRPGWGLLSNTDLTETPSPEVVSKLGVGSTEIDVVIGGPPCQPFSKARLWVNGKAADWGHPGARAFDAYFGIVEEVAPKAFLLENVPGAAPQSARPDQQTAFDRAQTHVRRINRILGTEYRLELLRIDAADFGVPQHRKRVFMVAFRDGASLSQPTPTHGADEGLLPRTTAWDAIGQLPVPDNVSDLAVKGRWADLLPSIPEGSNYQWHTSRGGGEPLFGWRTRYWSFLLKLDRNRPSWTIPASPGPATGPFHWDNRKLSVEELASLQTFPDTWEFAGNYDAARRQIGNAVPPALGELFGRALRGESLADLVLIPAHTRRVARSAKLPPVPKKYLALRGAHSPHPGHGLGPGAASRAAIA